MYYAHSREGLEKSEWQCLKDHLANTGNLAAELGSDAGISELARTAALLHDIGKYSQAFQRRLEGSNRRVDHSSAGARTARCWSRRRCGTCSSERRRNWRSCIR